MSALLLGRARRAFRSPSIALDIDIPALCFSRGVGGCHSGSPRVPGRFVSPRVPSCINAIREITSSCRTRAFRRLCSSPARISSLRTRRVSSSPARISSLRTSRVSSSPVRISLRNAENSPRISSRICEICKANASSFSGSCSSTMTLDSRLSTRPTSVCGGIASPFRARFSDVRDRATKGSGANAMPSLQRASTTLPSSGPTGKRHDRWCEQQCDMATERRPTQHRRGRPRKWSPYATMRSTTGLLGLVHGGHMNGLASDGRVLWQDRGEERWKSLCVD